MTTNIIHPVVIPKWGMTMDRATLVAWLKEEGSRVAMGDDLVEIETEKIANAIEAPHAGILRRQLGKAGETILCGALIGIIAEASVPEEAITAFVDLHAQTARKAPSEPTGPVPQMLEVEGHAIRYLLQGEGGVPVLLIHGFGGDLNNWLFVQPRLAKNRATYAVDLPGHGGSGKALGSIGSLGDVADLLVRFLDQLRVGKVHLVAHSLGAAIALSLAQRHAARIASMVLLSPVGLSAPPTRAFVDGLIAAKSRQQMTAVLKMLLADESLVTRDMVHDMLKNTRIDGVEAALRQFAEFIPHEYRAPASILADLSTPIQILWGDRDRIVPAPTANELPDNVPLTLLANVGHMPHLECSSQTVQLIEKALAT